MKDLEDIAALVVMIGQFSSYRKIAMSGAAALRRQYPGLVPAEGTPEARLAVLLTAADCWESAARLAGEVLAKRRGK